MNRIINRIAVLGSGVMGSRIACHFANAGLEVLLLDIVPKNLNEDEKNKGLDLTSPRVRNRIVNTSLETAVKSNPSPLFKKSLARHISTGNFEDDMHKLSGCDWIIEAVIENADIKKVFLQKLKSTENPEH